HPGAAPQRAHPRQSPAALAPRPRRAARRCPPHPPRLPRCEIAAPYPSRFPCESAPPGRATRSESDSTKPYFLWCRVQDSSDDLCHAVPLFGFALQPALSGRGEAVILRLSIVVRLTPFTRNPTLMFKAITGGIHRALLNLQTIF